jgi:hypothetical protein
MGFYDASSGGNLLHWSTLTNSRSVFTSDTPSFAAGSISFTED